MTRTGPPSSPVRRPLPATLVAVICTALAALLLSAAPAAAAPATAGTTAGDPAGPQLRPPYLVVGGTVLHSADGRCPVAANARGGSVTYGIMAGGCGRVGTTWFADAALTMPVGTTVYSSHPSPRVSLVRYTDEVDSPAQFFNGRGYTRVSGVQPPAVGGAVCHWSQVAGLRCGTVTAVNQTVTFPGGTLTGLFRSNACAEPGDLGLPAFAGSRLVGFVVGGTGGCATGGSTFYQPLGPILSQFGLTVVY